MMKRHIVSWQGVLIVFFMHGVVCARMKRVEYYSEQLGCSDLSTEQKIYDSLKQNPLACDITCLQVPWYPLIVRARENNRKFDKVSLEQVERLEKVKLDQAFTVCGYGGHQKILHLLPRMGVQTIFCTQGDNKVHDGVRCVPILYYSENGAPPAKRKDILYSFIGFGGGKVRKKLNPRRLSKGVVIKIRSNFHFFVDPKQRENERREHQPESARAKYSCTPREAIAYNCD